MEYDIFNCSIDELLELKFHLDALQILKSLSYSLQSIQIQSGVFHCHFLKDFIVCDSSISTEVKALIGEMAKGCSVEDTVCPDN